MKDQEYFEFVVKDLTELEMESLLRVVNEKVIKDQMGGLLDILRTDLADELDQAEANLGEAEEKIEEYEDQLKEVNQAVAKALVDLETCQEAIEEDHPTWELPELDNAIKILENI